MLLPQGSVSTESLRPIHMKLVPTACREWKRGDIWGLFPAAYALLLRSVPAVLASPRAGSHTAARSPDSIDVRSNFGAFLGAPTDLNSLTFARLCLLPAVRKPSRLPGTKCDTQEFLLSVLSEYVSHLMDVLSVKGDLPGK